MFQKYKIKFTSKAKSDYYNMLESSLNISKKYFKKINEKFNLKIQYLLKNPYIYPMAENNENFRKIIIYNYILIYQICNEEIVICRIFFCKVPYEKYI